MNARPWILLLVAACNWPGTTALPGNPEPVEPTEPAVVARGTVPVYGGTMAATMSDLVVADPGSDLVVHVDTSRAGIHPVAFDLPDGSEPFRIAIDATLAFVTLRGTGQVAAIDLTTDEIVGTRYVCSEPRGVAAWADEVFVACASGELVELDQDLAVRRTANIEPDLRDVVIDGDALWVSTFKEANVLRLDRANLQIQQRSVPALGMTDQPQAVARVGWRMRAHPDGGVLLMHLGGTTEPIPLTEGGKDPSGREGGNAYGGDACLPESTKSSTHFTHVDQGLLRTGGALMTGGPRYDFALEGDMVLVPNGGLGLGDVFFGDGSGFTSMVHLEELMMPTCVFDMPMQEPLLDGIVTAIGVSGGRTWTFTREPSMLTDGADVSAIAPATTNRGSHEVFHTAQVSGLACATCHPEGQDDGHVWNFEGIGPRRTQNLSGGVSERAPFHWDGEFGTLRDLMSDVFVGRMGGEELTGQTTDELMGYLDDVPPVRSAPQDAALVAQGKGIFESAEAACTGCHSGEQYSDFALHVVRADGVATKTPSLLGVGNRAPYMHDGCAETLEQRIVDEACGGGDLHGTTSHLVGVEVDALAAYLRTL